MWQLSKKRNIFVSWFFWHYIIGFRELVIMCRDFLFFVWHYFSIPFLFKTFFSPWKKQKLYGSKRFDLKIFLDALVFNLFSRFMGGLIRFVAILVGMFFQALTLLVVFLVIFFWALMPFAIILSLPIYIWLILI